MTQSKYSTFQVHLRSSAEPGIVAVRVLRLISHSSEMFGHISEFQKCSLQNYVFIYIISRDMQTLTGHQRYFDQK